jgi:competence protein ComEA
MNRIFLYGRWILLAAVLLAAGFCYSCGTDKNLSGRMSAVVYESDAGTKSETRQTEKTEENEAPENGAVRMNPVESTMMETVPVRVCYVHVCGEVASPGVYQIPEGSRVYEAVQAAGGFTEAAASDYLNLAETVKDGMKIVIPDRENATKLEEAGVYPAGSAAEAGVYMAGSGPNGESVGGKVNINTADSTALMTLSGIGEARAAAIIQYREEHGKFSSIEEIMQVPGIKEAAFQKIKQNIEI